MKESSSALVSNLVGLPVLLVHVVASLGVLASSEKQFVLVDVWYKYLSRYSVPITLGTAISDEQR